MISPSTASAPSSAWSTSPPRPSATGSSGTGSSPPSAARAATGSTRAGRSSSSGSSSASSTRPATGGGPPPARRHDRSGSAVGPRRRAEGPRVLILLAERDPYAAEFAEYFLRTEGYEVVLALDAAEAERTSVERRPDLAVVEVMISGGTGPSSAGGSRRRAWPRAWPSPHCRRRTTPWRPARMRSSGSRSTRCRFVSTVKDLLGRSAFLHDGPEGGSDERAPVERQPRLDAVLGGGLPAHGSTSSSGCRAPARPSWRSSTCSRTRRLSARRCTCPPFPSRSRRSSGTARRSTSSPRRPSGARSSTRISAPSSTGGLDAVSSASAS